MPSSSYNEKRIMRHNRVDQLRQQETRVLPLRDRDLAKKCNKFLRNDSFSSIRASPVKSPMARFINNQNDRGGAEVHWVKKGEQTPGFRPRKLSVEINDWAAHHTDLLNRENVFLHEFSHVYNGTIGQNHSKIVSMHERAVKSGLYDCVKMCDGSKPRKAYGIQNHLEFFASLSVAFLGGHNDYYPFTREDLLEFDPASHRDLIDIWSLCGDRGLVDNV